VRLTQPQKRSGFGLIPAINDRAQFFRELGPQLVVDSHGAVWRIAWGMAASIDGKSDRSVARHRDEVVELAVEAVRARPCLDAAGIPVLVYLRRRKGGAA